MQHSFASSGLLQGLDVEVRKLSHLAPVARATFGRSFRVFGDAHPSLFCRAKGCFYWQARLKVQLCVVVFLLYFYMNRTSLYGC